MTPTGPFTRLDNGKPRSELSKRVARPFVAAPAIVKLSNIEEFFKYR
jgi:hypothetical protein